MDLTLFVPQIEYTPLNVEQPEARLLKLHPTSDVSEHFRCDLEIHTLLPLPPFLAIGKARGYRNVEEAIKIVHAGTRNALVISAALNDSYDIYKPGLRSQHTFGFAMLVCSDSIARNSKDTGHDNLVTRFTQQRPLSSTRTMSTIGFSKMDTLRESSLQETVGGRKNVMGDRMK
jgi:hypothetical protein